MGRLAADEPMPTLAGGGDCRSSPAGWSLPDGSPSSSPRASRRLPSWHGLATWAIAVELVMIGSSGAAGLGAIFGRMGFAEPTLAGLLLVLLAVNCCAAEHHLGNWWLAELGAAIALAGLAAVGLGQRLRGKQPPGQQQLGDLHGVQPRPCAGCR